MKKLIKVFSSILTCLLFGLNSLSGQDLPVPFFSKEIQLIGKTETKEIAYPFIIESLNSVTFKVISLIDSGEVIIELYTPSGEKNPGYFKLGGNINHVMMKKWDKNNTNKKVSGWMSRTIPKPMNGAWKAKIISKSAYGLITLQLLK
jgi:hypothetical protein